MEAKKFGFGEDMPPGCVFDPTDADIVAHYLLPRAASLHNPYGHAIIEDDPYSAPPWEILERHGHRDSFHAFFFYGPPADASRNGRRKSRRARTVPGGGVWQRLEGYGDTVVTLARANGDEVDVRYKRSHLVFSLAKPGTSTAYVIDEYEILSPPLPGTVLTRITALKKAYGPPVVDVDGAEEQHTVLQVPEPRDVTVITERFAGM